MNKIFPKIMIIDHSGICHTVKFALAKTAMKNKGKDTFVIFGYLQQLVWFFKQIYPEVTVIACDSRKSKRKEIFKDYKKKEEKSPELEKLDSIAFPQFSELQKSVLPKIGFRNIFEVDGLEADDIIARVCKDYQNSEIVIVSRDKDLYQLLSKKVSIYEPYSKKFYTYEDFKDEWGIEPKQWKKVKQIGGCSSDKVPGVPGVKEKTAIKFILGKLPKTYKTFQAILENSDIIKRNKKLVNLPFKGTPSFELYRDCLNKKGLKKIAKQYGFMSIKEDFSAWKKALHLK